MKKEDFKMGVEKKKIEKKAHENRESSRVVVEVGLGQSPFFFRADRKIAKNEHYVGLDIPGETEVTPEIFQALKDKTEFKNKVDGKADLVVASGDRIPMSDASADEVIFKDVFSAPSNYFYDARKKVYEKVMRKSGTGYDFMLRREAYEKLQNYASVYKDTNLYGDTIMEYKSLLETWKLLPWNKTKKRDKKSAKDVAYRLESICAEDIEFSKKSAFIGEAKRVLKNQGKLVIIEVSGTVEIATRYIEFLRYAETSPFRLAQVWGPRDKELKQYVQRENNIPAPDHWRVYVFTKKQREVQ